MIRSTLIAGAALTALGACSNGAQIGSGDLADTATTVYALVEPDFVEANPIFPSDPLLAVPVILGMKYGAKAGLIEIGVPVDTANRTIDAFGWAAACHNMALFAGAATPALPLIAFTCGAVYWEASE